jgi:hypothetical protein
MCYEPYYIKTPLTTPPLPAPVAQRAVKHVFTSVDALHNVGFLDKMQTWFDKAIAWMIASTFSCTSFIVGRKLMTTS